MMTIQIAMLTLGGLLTLGLLAYAFLGDNVGKTSSRRMTAVKLRHSNSADSIVEQQMRKAVAARRPMIFQNGQHMSRSDKLRLRLAQTGKNWSFKQYIQVSAGLSVVVFALLMIKGTPIAFAIFGSLMVGAGLPHMVIGSLIKRRVKRFTTNFPDAIELVVRGLKSGLPVGETLAVIAKEIPGPVGVEFKMITEKIKIGKTMEDAMQETADRLGTAEFQFFVITLAIQRETGGNLAETLANLADVLRKRAQMKLKVKALSSEAKASAYIIGALPFVLFATIYVINSEYIGGFFSEPRLMITGLGAMVWMSLGVFIMSKMINFEI
jgi:tight adherence protein B